MINSTSIFSTSKFLEEPYKASLLYEAMQSPEKEIKDLVAAAKEKQAPTVGKISLFVQKIWHNIKLYISTSYKENFTRAAIKIDLYESRNEIENPDVKNAMLTALGAQVALRMKDAWSALLSDADDHLQSWDCGNNGNFTLTFKTPVSILIPADKATFLFAQTVTGNLDQSSKKITFGSGLTTSVSGVAGYPYIFWMSYKDGDDSIAVRGGYADHWPVAKTQETPAATIIANWQGHQIL
jgi:hypothetical protein